MRNDFGQDRFFEKLKVIESRQDDRKDVHRFLVKTYRPETNVGDRRGPDDFMTVRQDK